MSNKLSESTSAVEGSAIGERCLGRHNSFGVPTKPMAKTPETQPLRGQWLSISRGEWNALGSPTKPITAKFI